MRPKEKIFTLINDDDYLALAQLLAAAQDLVLELVHRQPVTPQGVTLTSAGALGGVNFTIVGLDANGLAQTEVLAGPAATTVTSANLYSRVDSITSDAGTGASTIEAGFDGLTDFMMPLDVYAPVVRVAVSISAGGGTWSIEHGYINPLKKGFVWADMVWHTTVALTGITTNLDYFFDAPIWALRFLTTVATAGTNVIVFTVIPVNRLDTGER